MGAIIHWFNEVVSKMPSPGTWVCLRDSENSGSRNQKTNRRPTATNREPNDVQTAQGQSRHVTPCDPSPLRLAAGMPSSTCNDGEVGILEVVGSGQTDVIPYMRISNLYTQETFI